MAPLKGAGGERQPKAVRKRWSKRRPIDVMAVVDPFLPPITAMFLAALEDQLADINTVVAKTNTSGLGRYLARVEAVADQIVETPKYAEAMGKMLFGADAQDPIVQLLIGTSLSFNREELAEMAVSGELRQETDRDFLARLLSSAGWSTVLMWMKGYVALHDFKQEYVRNAVTIMLPYVTQAAEKRLRQLL